MDQALEGLKPESVWRYFGEISGIPRGSKNEAAAAAFVLETAKRLGLWAAQDGVGNVIVRKSASAGRESSPSVCLQGHLDMVCEKNADVVHDFMKDPIRLVRKDNILMAAGTTLGADNGIAVATMLALLEEKDTELGPLEMLFTIDEETGLTGAGSLQADFLLSRTMLNLDSEEEGTLCVGCAGGKDTIALWSIKWEAPAPKAVACEVHVKGLLGGHSGIDIHKGLGNALKILCRVLRRLEEMGARVASIQGGNKRNAIPREASASIYLPGSKIKKATALVRDLDTVLRAEIATVDPGLSVSFQALGQKEGKVLARPLQKRLLRTLSALPHGVTKMSADIPGLVETSTNVAVVRINEETAAIETSQRSSVASEIAEIVETVTSVLGLAGATVETGKGYPGWKPDLGSRVLKVAQETFKDLFGREAEVKAVHAGL